MKTKTSPREEVFVVGTSRNREAPLTLRLQMAMEEKARLEMGARIRKLRVAAGLKQKEIADYCGVELRTYQFWQQGASPPTGDALPKLSELLRSRGLDYATESYIINGASVQTPNLAEALEPAWVSRIEATLAQILDRLGEEEDTQDLGGDAKDATDAIDEVAAAAHAESGPLRPPVADPPPSPVAARPRKRASSSRRA